MWPVGGATSQAGEGSEAQEKPMNGACPLAKLCQVSCWTNASSWCWSQARLSLSLSVSRSLTHSLILSHQNPKMQWTRVHASPGFPTSMKILHGAGSGGSLGWRARTFSRRWTPSTIRRPTGSRATKHSTTTSARLHMRPKTSKTSMQGWHSAETSGYKNCGRPGTASLLICSCRPQSSTIIPAGGAHFSTSLRIAR